MTQCKSNFKECNNNFRSERWKLQQVFYTSFILPEVPTWCLNQRPSQSLRVHPGRKNLWTQQIAVAAALNSPQLWQETHHPLDPTACCSHCAHCQSSHLSNPRWPPSLLQSTNRLKLKTHSYILSQRYTPAGPVYTICRRTGGAFCAGGALGLKDHQLQAYWGKRKAPNAHQRDQTLSNQHAGKMLHFLWQPWRQSPSIRWHLVHRLLVLELITWPERCKKMQNKDLHQNGHKFLTQRGMTEETVIKSNCYQMEEFAIKVTTVQKKQWPKVTHDQMEGFAKVTTLTTNMWMQWMQQSVDAAVPSPGGDAEILKSHITQEKLAKHASCLWHFLQSRYTGPDPLPFAQISRGVLVFCPKLHADTHATDGIDGIVKHCIQVTFPHLFL